jgi:RNAse (barnase) inhibitor barstar
MKSMGFIKTNQNIENMQTTIVPETFTHSCAIGQTGCGKTTGYIYPNMLNRIKNNHSLIVFDYKGKEHNAVKVFANQCDRLNDIEEIGKDWGRAINLLKYMNDAVLENFLFELFALDGADNVYWGRSATNISMTILKVLGCMEQILYKADDINLRDEMENVIDGFKFFTYPKTKSLYSLSLVVKSVDELKGFVRNLDRLYDNLLDEIKELIIIDFEKLSKDKIKKKYHEILYVMEKFKIDIEKTKNNLNSFETSSSNNAKTLQTIILAMNTPLINIANIKWLNEDQFDIVESLNKGKIIIFNTKTFSENILASYCNAIFLELTKRITITNLKPISIFVDEAQRIMSRKTDLPIDVLREAKVDLFLAFQNEELMIQKLGEIKYVSLIKNMKNQYVFKNIGFYNDQDLSKLETFEYFIDEDEPEKNIAESVFLEKNELFNVELKFQKGINLHDKYNLKGKDKNRIIIHDEYAIKDNIIYLMDKFEKIYQRSFLDNEISLKVFDLIDNVLLNDFRNDDEDYNEDDILNIFQEKLDSFNLKVS